MFSIINIDATHFKRNHEETYMNNPNILVPTDFSELSRWALQAANQWVRLFGGYITPMYAYEAVTDLDGFHFYGPKKSVEGNLTTINEAVQDLMDESARLDVDAAHLQESIFVTGNPAFCIAKTSLNYDMIIISSHGRSGIKRFLLGSVTDKLINLSPIPVLVVKEKSILNPMERILVLTDLSLNSETAFSYAKEVANKTGAVIELLYVHVSDSSEVIATEALENMLRSFIVPHFADARGRVETKVLLSGGSAHQGINHYLKERKFNLIIMATAGKSSIEHLLLGSTSAQVARDAHTAVLFVPPDYQRDLRQENLRTYY